MRKPSWRRWTVPSPLFRDVFCNFPASNGLRPLSMKELPVNEIDYTVTQPPRGNFPSGPAGEDAAQRRERYEQWILATGPAGRPDYEYASIRFYRDRTKRVRERPGSAEMKTVPATASRRLCATSRCWQCEAGGSDPNAADRILACTVTQCGLWPVRPYRASGDNGDILHSQAIDLYCRQCMGLVDQKQNVKPVINACSAVTCSIWPVRPGRNPSRPSEQSEPETSSNGNALTTL